MRHQRGNGGCKGEEMKKWVMTSIERHRGTGRTSLSLGWRLVANSSMMKRRPRKALLRGVRSSCAMYRVCFFCASSFFLCSA
jgi:hypothetical protein